MSGSSDKGKPIVMAIARIGMGWLFLWPFLDKAFGLGFTTDKDAAWIRGGHPTEGFLKFGADSDGPLHGLFDALAGHAWVDWIFMIGLLGIGVALILGIGMRIACWSGMLLVFLMWLAVMPMDSGTDHNPFWDDHLQYASFLAVLLFFDAGQYFGLGGWWRSQPFVQKYPWLQ